MAQIYEPFYRPIGHFIVRFAEMENHLIWAIKVWLGVTEHQSRAICAQIQSFESKIYLFQVSVRLATHDESKLHELQQIVERLRHVNAARNALLHGMVNGITLPDGTLSKLRFDAKGTLKFIHREFSVDEINIHAREAMSVSIEIGRFTHNCALLQPSQRKSS